MKTKVMIVEDNEPLNDLFRDIINSSENFKVSGSYLNAEDTLKFFKDDMPNIVLMDIELPKMSGIQCTKELKKINPNVLVIMVTVYENSATVFDALCAGATGYLTKNASSEKLIASLNEALAGGAPMSINIAKMVVQSFQKSPDSILTERETEVLNMLARGSSYKSIALTFEISVNTIKYHIKNIYDKLQVHCKEDAIEEASKRKLI
ncbi:response regulator transcription factor [Hyunsoonleella sp. SJ7]|uniref:Response regulator transcription factor n=1 Tax=Hyunsoonleella aquatilis TaxID=2762758 RepID=A0A923KJ78_9FLAO|nr:response regulator transcription factor [Hyunsoonleella aquatilis]MBC3757027.1 response regulator transcription factor [Hyunsoonleella aquatilis]